MHAEGTHRFRLAVCAATLVAGLAVWLISPGLAKAAEFGVTGFESAVTNQSGSPAVQAGEHPYQISTFIKFAQEVGGGKLPTGSVKDIEVEAPPGFVGNPNATAKCPIAVLDNVFEECPLDTQVGIAKIEFPEGLVERYALYNLVPVSGVPAMFGFTVLGQPIYAYAKVRTGTDNGVTIAFNDISQTFALTGTGLTLWGVPADHSHDGERGRCIFEGGSCLSLATPQPFLTNPTYCRGALTSTLHTDSWQEPGVDRKATYTAHDSSGAPTQIEGCNELSFTPTITAAPDTTQADTPAGLTVDVNVPQEGLGNPSGLAMADLENTTVTLPPGVAINPGQAAGLASCSAEQDALGTEAAPTCPASSKVGTVVITTPLLSEKIEGNVYILPSNPPDLQLLVEGSADGVNLKFVGTVHLDSSGRVAATFENTPQLPFNDLKLSFSGGAQAALTTPPTCGLYTTTSDFTPAAAPALSDAFPTSAFAITSGPGGGGCASTLPFAPTLHAGATTDQAGGYTSFSLLLQRADGEQRVSSLQFKTPEGLLGMISKVPLCSEAQADQDACPASSQIGHTVVQAGPGPDPLVVPQPGQSPAPIYLTGGYKGAPYGLLIAVPIIAGPFNLGTVVVRASIAVDPHTAQLTITTDPLPSILDGVPTDLRTINAVIDRAGFMFNPTSCAPMSFGGTATAIDGRAAPIAAHFQVGSCQSLKFAPKFVVSTSGNTSRKNGASLDAKIVYPTAALAANQASQQSNIAKVKVDLPKQLPSRLTTLQKACLAAVFAANPSNCPAASVVGSGTAVTPVLGVPLSGPAYFVSHGGEAFPDLVVVLQGSGVTVDLTGSTFISKTGITSSTFKSVPDVPITTFELKLPEGPHSALGANQNLCTQKLAMPTAFVAQNGTEIHESTKISVTSCPKAKKKAIKKKAGTKKAGTKPKKAGRKN
jgi:hypothetical protein